jgi:hypothetical protein
VRAAVVWFVAWRLAAALAAVTLLALGGCDGRGAFDAVVLWVLLLAMFVCGVLAGRRRK